MAGLEIGQWGTVTVAAIHRRKVGTGRYNDVKITQHDDGRWYALEDTERTTPLELSRHRARALYRDTDGKTRAVQAEGTSAAAARRNLHAKLTKRSAPATAGTLNPNSTMRELWTAREAELVADGKALRTLDAYRPAAAKILTALGDVKAHELTTGMVDGYLQEVKADTGASSAQLARSVFSGLCSMAVRLDVMDRNPVREARSVRPKKSRSVTVPTEADLERLLDAVRTSEIPLPPKPGAKKATTGSTIGEFCHRLNADLADLVTFMAGTGVRISDALAVRWSDLDLDAGTVTLAGHIVRAHKVGLVWVDGSKAGDARVIALPAFVVAALMARSVQAVPNPLDAVFPSKAGTWSDPDNVRDRWRRVRGPLGFDALAPHDFRRAVSTIAKDAGVPDRDNADHLGHSKVQQSHEYMAGGRVNRGVADALQSRLGNSSEGPEK